MRLQGLDGNAFSLMGAFSKNAKKQGWSQKEIDEVIAQCMSADYDNLIRVLCQNTEE